MTATELAAISTFEMIRLCEYNETILDVIKWFIRFVLITHLTLKL